MASRWWGCWGRIAAGFALAAPVGHLGARHLDGIAIREAEKERLSLQLEAVRDASDQVASLQEDEVQQANVRVLRYQELLEQERVRSEAASEMAAASEKQVEALTRQVLQSPFSCW